MASVRLMADVGGPACRGCAYEPVWLMPAREPPVPLVHVPNLMTRARPPVTIDQRRTLLVSAGRAMRRWFGVNIRAFAEGAVGCATTGVTLAPERRR